MLPKELEKYTNYNSYLIGYRKGQHEVNEQRLMKFIGVLIKKYKNPYIRFMWVSNADKPMCVIYSDVKKMERATKLIPFDEAENNITEEGV